MSRSLRRLGLPLTLTALVTLAPLATASPDAVSRAASTTAPAASSPASGGIGATPGSTQAVATFVVTANSSLTVRSGPSTAYTRIGSVARGTTITGTKQSNGWVKFTHGTRTGYASGVYLRATTGPFAPRTAQTTLHVAPGAGLFVDVYSRPMADEAYVQHYLPRGGMVKGTVEGIWFKMAENRWVPLAELTSSHTTYSTLNGRHDPATLCTVEGSSVVPHVLIGCKAVTPLKGLNQAYRARFGSDLPWDECYRTYDTQVAYRRAFGTKAAVPGYSNHGSTTRPACDVPEDPRLWGFGTARYQWMLANGPRFGWVHPSWAKPWGTNPEYWHFEYAG